MEAQHINQAVSKALTSLSQCHSSSLDEAEARWEAAEARRKAAKDAYNSPEAKHRRAAQAADALFDKAGVMPRHRNRPPRIDTGGAREWRDMLAKCNEKIGSGVMLMLTGDRGNGKTQLAVEMLRHGCWQGKTGKYERLTGFFMDVKSSFRTDVPESDVLAEYTAPDVLVLDECHERNGSAWESGLLTYMIDTRYGFMKDTILVANLPADVKPDQLRETLGPSVVSRMRETGGVIPCKWESFR